MRYKLIAGTTLALMLPALAWAQTATTGGTETSAGVATYGDAGAFATLSPGNQRIAEALFAAQTGAAAQGTAGGTTAGAGAEAGSAGALSLDQLAMANQ